MPGLDPRNHAVNLNWETVTPILDHIRQIIRPALKDYTEAENQLTRAQQENNPEEIDRARQKTIRNARIAAIELHQLADVVLKVPSSLPFKDISDVRSMVAAKCTFLRTTNSIDDVRLLMDVADAFKHYQPDRKNITVAGASAVITVTTGFGEMFFGEGKFGGEEEVVVTLKDGGKRALSSILQNVFDAWMNFLNQPMLPIDEY